MSVYAPIYMKDNKDDKEKLSKKDINITTTNISYVNKKINKLEKKSKNHFIRVHADIEEVHECIDNANYRIDIIDKDISTLLDKLCNQEDDINKNIRNISNIYDTVNHNRHYNKISFILCYILSIIAIITSIIAINM